MPNATITGWGKCLPPSVLSNHDLEQLVDTSDDWITTRTGIKERRISHVEVSDLAAVASRHALAAAGKSAADLDLIVLATCTGDSIIPSTASILQAKLEAWNAAAFDLNAACSGFVYALVVAGNMIKAGTHRTVLVVGAEKLHFHIDFTDRTTCVLFGDGAGAVVLESTDAEVGILSSELGMDGSAASILCIPRDGTSGDRDYPEPSQSRFQMDGPELFRRAVVRMGEASVSRDREGRSDARPDRPIDPPSSQRSHHRCHRPPTRPRLRQSLRQHPVLWQHLGRHDSRRTDRSAGKGRIQPGDNVVFTAFGAGLSWGAAVVRWGDRVEPHGDQRRRAASEHSLDDGAPRAKPQVLRPPNRERRPNRRAKCRRIEITSESVREASS